MAATGSEYVIKAPLIFDGEEFLSDHCVTVRNGAVTQVLPVAAHSGDLQIITLQGGTLAPGFIDLQVNGGGGVMLNNTPSAQTINRISAAHLGLGTTSLLPTVISDTPGIQRAAVAAVREARLAGNLAIAGIHIEGPFFAPARRGAHRADMIRRPGRDDIDWLCSLQDLPVIVTLAPERVSLDSIRQLAAAGIHLCAGHTNANHPEVEAAAAAGLEGFTHLFNAMSPLTAREPGTTGAALQFDGLWAGVIADGHHVHEANLRMAHRAKPPGKLVLVSDAMATVGSASNEFALYGETIRLQGGKLVNGEGALAGSAIALIDAVRYASQILGLPLAECLRMASLYPATILGLEKSLGKIAPGFRADFIHFDEHFQAQNSWLAGALHAN